MKISTIVLIVIAVVVLLGIGYWFMTSSGSPAPATTQIETSTTPPTTTTVLTLASSTTLGPYLSATNNNLTLYTYADDQPNVSNCTGTCATTWPPYTVQSTGGLQVGAGITGTVSTLTRADGTLQVTYNGMPLYFYSGDVNPGDTNGNGVGGTWSIAKP